MNAVIRVLIADDHPMMREGLAALIARRPDMSVEGEASNGREAVELFRQHRPDVTLMDLRMPIMDGFEAIRTIHAEFPVARILVFTTYDGDEDVHRALKAGAISYLLKDAPHEEILDAIRTAHRGQQRVSSGVAARLVARIHHTELTERELEVLLQIVAGKSNQEIGVALFVREGTIKTHVSHILAKLGVSDRTDAAIVAIKRGIVHLD